MNLSRFQIGIILSTLCLPSLALAIPDKDTGNLGEIRHSLLNLQEFQELYGDAWVVMDGRDLPSDCDLHRAYPGWKALPDARGVFLRSSNCGRSRDRGNPSGDIPVGTYEYDELKCHDHEDLGHSHTCEINLGSSHNLGQHPGPAQGSGSGWANSTLHGSASTSYARIKDTGGPETRPRCVVVNTYVKINRTPRNKQTEALSKAFGNLPKRVSENESLRDSIREMVREEVRKANSNR